MEPPLITRVSSPQPSLTYDDNDDLQTVVDSEPLKVTPLPKFQLFIAIFIQVSEPVTCTVIYPFVNDLIRSLGINHGDETKTGYYVGVVESIFYAAECLTVMHWGRASDVIGRKPILLGGMAGLALSMFGFGLSNRYWALLVSRCFQGAFNGNVGVTKSVMAEITDATNAPQAFAFLPVAWSVGSTLGPAIGGVFSNPSTTWPRVFGHIQFFKTYPYFLPCLIAALVPIFAFLLGLVALKETAPHVLHRRRLKELQKNDHIDPSFLEEIHASHSVSSSETASLNYGTIGPCAVTSHSKRSSSADTLSASSESSESNPLLYSTTSKAFSKPTAAAPPSFRSVFIPQVLIPITNFAFLAFLDQCVLVLIPLIYSTPLELGGLSMTPTRIGTILGGWGLLNGVFQVFCFAWVRRTLGHRVTYMVGIAGLGLTFSLFPVLSAVARWEGSKVGPWVYLTIALQLGCYSFSYMSYACMFLYIAAAAPSRSSLGTTNGLAQLTASGVRALAPTASSSLFSLSLALRARHGGTVGCIGGLMVFIILNTLTVASLVWSRWLPEELVQRKD